MKKVYHKPLITVEALVLDEPIALGCVADKGDILLLEDMGYFSAEKNCEFRLLPGGGIDEDEDGQSDGFDTVCYHTNIAKAFYS